MELQLAVVKRYLQTIDACTKAGSFTSEARTLQRELMHPSICVNDAITDIDRKPCNAFEKYLKLRVQQ